MEMSTHWDVGWLLGALQGVALHGSSGGALGDGTTTLHQATCKHGHALSATVGVTHECEASRVCVLHSQTPDHP
jgi:hypothetical protein